MVIAKLGGVTVFKYQLGGALGWVAQFQGPCYNPVNIVGLQG